MIQYLPSMKTKICSLVFWLVPLLLAAQQDRQVYGYVTEETGTPLSGATIIKTGTNTGSVTDSMGYFTISAQAGDQLEFLYLGYESQVITLSESTVLPLRISMVVSTKLIEDFVVVQAVRSPVEARTPAPLMTLYPADLQRDDGNSIRPALNRLPGVFMHSGTLSTNRITIRGIGNRSPFGTAKIRAYFNDIPLTNGVGETTLEDIDLSLVDQVTVWKGPTGSTYGAGLGGMIQLKSLPYQERAGTHAQVEGTYGAYGTRRLSAGLQFGTTPKQHAASWNTRLHYHNLHSDGYRENNQYDRHGAALISNYQDAKGNITSLLANFIDLKAFIPSSVSLNDYLNEPRKAAFTWAQVKGAEDSQKFLLGLSHQHDLLKNREGAWVLQNISSLFGTWYENYEGRPFNILSEDNQAFGGRSRFILRPGGKPRFSLQAGAELFVEDYNWQTYRTDGGRQDTLLSDNAEVRSYYNLFAEATLLLGRHLRLETGLNVNQTRYKLTDNFLRDNVDISGDYRFATIVSPRLGLLYNLPAALKLFANISHGFASPTLEETLTPEGSINPDIQPEKGWNFELGLRRNDPDYLFNFELTAYRMPISDLLVARRTALDQYVGINAGKTLHQGLEAYAQYALLGGNFGHKTLSVYAGYTYSHYRFTTFIDGENDYSGNVLTGTPPNLFSAGLDYNLIGDGIYGNLNFSYVDAMPLRDDNTVYSDAYSLMNIKLGYRKTVYIADAKPMLLNVFAGVNNLWDEKYAGMFQVNAAAFGTAAPRYYYPGLPRHLYAGLRLSL